MQQLSKFTSFILLLVALVQVNWSETPHSISPDLVKLPENEHYQYFRKATESPLLRESNSNSILAAIKLNKGKKQLYWWMQMQLDSPSEQTITETTTQSLGTLYTSTGRSFTFTSNRSRLNSRIIGPLKKKHVSESTERFFSPEINSDFLTLGLDKLHEFFEAANRHRSLDPDGEQMSYTIKSVPLDQSEMIPSEVLEIMELSEASERAFVGALPALNEFFTVIYETDGLKDILLNLVPKKIIFSLLNPLSKKQISFGYGSPQPTQIDASSLNLGIDKVELLPVTLYFGEKPLLDIRLYATIPYYEWKSCGGIVAIEVVSQAKKGNSCFIRAFPQKWLLHKMTDREDSTSPAEER